MKCSSFLNLFLKALLDGFKVLFIYVKFIFLERDSDQCTNITKHFRVIIYTLAN